MGVDARMFLSTKLQLTPRAVTQLAATMCERFGANKFYIDREGGQPHHALELVDAIEQDGPTIAPRRHEQLMYERGDIVSILAIARWLQDHVPDARIFYGGDSSGVCAERLDPAALWRHFSEHGHAPYRAGFDSVFNSTGAHVCTFCAGMAMHSTGGGGGLTYLVCDGCGTRIVYDKKTEKAHLVGEDEDFFAASTRIQESPNA